MSCWGLGAVVVETGDAQGGSGDLWEGGNLKNVGSSIKGGKNPLKGIRVHIPYKDT